MAEFYRGKTIRIVIPLPAGSGSDVGNRVLARHMSRYIPGTPSIIVENKPGAGGFLAANLVYNVEPKDGTVLVGLLEGNVLQQVMGKEGIEFDARKFQWIGAGVDDRGSCVARTDTGIKTVEDIIGGKELMVAATAPGATTFDIPTVLKAALGANFKVVPGYAGGPESILAVQNKEVDGYCVSFTAMLNNAARLLAGDSPTVKFIALLGADVWDHPLLKGVPPAETLAKTDEARQMLRLVGSPGKFTYPLAVAPGVPVDRVTALRSAFEQTMVDPQFKEDNIKARGGDFPWRTGQSVAGVVDELFNTPTPVLAKVKEILK